MAPEHEHETGASGYFPAGSMLHAVQWHRLVGATYGRRALVLGATSPVPYVGTSSSTLAKERPFTRLVRTAEAFETIFFGDRSAADRVLAKVGRMHERVRGELPEDEGIHPAGTPYDAMDPELMLWTMGVLADSSRHAYEHLVRPLTGRERDDLWSDWIRFGELFGMPRGVAPEGAGDFDDWIKAHLDGPGFHVTAEARAVGRAILLDMPVPAHLRRAVGISTFLVIGLLPERVKYEFGIEWSGGDERRHRAACRAVRAAHRLLPTSLTHGSNTERFALVRATEEEIIAQGGRTIVLPSEQPGTEVVSGG